MSTNKVTQPKISKNNSKKNYIKTFMSEDEVYINSNIENQVL